MRRANEGLPTYSRGNVNSITKRFDGQRPLRECSAKKSTMLTLLALYSLSSDRGVDTLGPHAYIYLRLNGFSSRTYPMLYWVS